MAIPATDSHISGWALYAKILLTACPITLKKDNYDKEIHRLLHEETYTLLSHLLITEGYTQEKVNQISTAIHNISNNKAIKTYQYCLRNWINF